MSIPSDHIGSWEGTKRNKHYPPPSSMDYDNVGAASLRLCPSPQLLARGSEARESSARHHRRRAERWMPPTWRDAPEDGPVDCGRESIVNQYPRSDGPRNSRALENCTQQSGIAYPRILIPAKYMASNSRPFSVSRWPGGDRTNLYLTDYFLRFLTKKPELSKPARAREEAGSGTALISGAEMSLPFKVTPPMRAIARPDSKLAPVFMVIS